MIAYFSETPSADRHAEIADFLRACTSTKPTPQNLEIVDALVESIREAMKTSNLRPLRNLTAMFNERNSPIDDLMAAAQHLLQLEIVLSPSSDVNTTIKNVAEAVRASSCSFYKPLLVAATG